MIVNFKTASSYWEVDLDKGLVRRSPLTPGADHPNVGYVEGWVPASMLSPEVSVGSPVYFSDLRSGAVVSIEAVRLA